MHAPAVGRLVAELVTGRSPSVDLSPLALERFREGRAQREHNVI
jgi:glycine/D-amino acid oxidase-like deaminating enzyme